MPSTPIHGMLLDDGEASAPAQPKSSREIARKAEEPASEGFVDESVRIHAESCPAARKVRRWAMGLCFALGALAASQWWIMYSGKAWIRESVRTAVREELGRTTVAATPPAPWLFPQAHAETKGNAP